MYQCVSTAKQVLSMWEVEGKTSKMQISLFYNSDLLCKIHLT